MIKTVLIVVIIDSHSIFVAPLSKMHTPNFVNAYPVLVANHATGFLL